MMRRAISPRLATRTRLNMVEEVMRSGWSELRVEETGFPPLNPQRKTLDSLDAEEDVAVLDRRAVLDDDGAMMVPDFSALISFITFIASMMQSVWPSATVSPTETKRSASGVGRR